MKNIPILGPLLEQLGCQFPDAPLESAEQTTALEDATLELEICYHCDQVARGMSVLKGKTGLWRDMYPAIPAWLVVEDINTHLVALQPLVSEFQRRDIP